ncbi:hypothetical protein CTheo_6628 [Ceratobasidium theobromae]|uniref:Uncharacterized protein n=1 Tax=Ceratobasidium theobromae TaxID=1582974 RepID=A0A5N5QF53_9AGAM|nr:hypothetical protein CTheo_6628 [Ceratobasidium theobromae]
MLCFITLFALRCPTRPKKDTWVMQITQAHLRTGARRLIRIDLYFQWGVLASVVVSHGPLSFKAEHLAEVVQLNKAEGFPRYHPDLGSVMSPLEPFRKHSKTIALLKELCDDENILSQVDESGIQFYLRLIKLMERDGILSQEDRQQMKDGVKSIRDMCFNFPHAPKLLRQ